MIKLISNQISPNLTLSDCWVGLSGLFGKQSFSFNRYFQTEHYNLYNAGRTGMADLIRQLNLPKNKAIAIPAFTCAVTATPFLEAGYTVKWIDVDDQGLIDFTAFEKIADEVSLVLCIHTFGQTVDLKKFKTLTHAKNIVLLEDCAHRLPNLTEPFESDIRLYSFGREKVVSCVSGGALVWNELSTFFTQRSENNLLKASRWATFRLLLHPLVYSLSLPWWHLGGKFIAYFFQKIKILPPIITAREKVGEEDFPQTQLHPALQKILYRQFKQYRITQKHRQQVAERWAEVLSEFGKVIIPKNAFRVIFFPNKGARIKNQKRMHLREWDGAPIAPKSVDLHFFHYEKGMCPKAEQYAKTYKTFPTNIRVKVTDIK